MPKVMMSYMDMPMGIKVTFSQGNRGLGNVQNFTDEAKLFEILRWAHAPVEVHQIMEMALRERRPGAVVLQLSDTQYKRLLDRIR